MKIKLPVLECTKCGHKWSPRSIAVPQDHEGDTIETEIRICPACKSAYWDVPKEKRNA